MNYFAKYKSNLLIYISSSLPSYKPVPLEISSPGLFPIKVT